MGEPDPVGHVLSVASFSDEDRAAVLGRNAARLFGAEASGGPALTGQLDAAAIVAELRMAASVLRPNEPPGASSRPLGYSASA